jgi:hypothetical protein
MTMNLALIYLYKVFIRPFQFIQLTPITTTEISEIINQLNGKTHTAMMRYQ